VVNEVSRDTLKFLEVYCKLKPYWYLLELIASYEKFQFNAVRWPRQTGKSTDIGALHLADAWNNEDLCIGFVGPSWRQTKLNVRRVASFCRNLPQQGLHVQKTKITMPNGSIIEAFPNNPDTIRGNTFHRIWWDETNFTANDEDLYDAILFTLGTTDGKLTASSSLLILILFWKMCNHRIMLICVCILLGEGVGPYVVEALLLRRLGVIWDDPARCVVRWSGGARMRSLLAQSLIVSCVGTVRTGF
jgi:hypothetical protein